LLKLKNIPLQNIDAVLVSGFDSIVPSNYQIPFPSEDRWFDGKVYFFNDFQHMDFYTGGKEKVKKTADFIINQIKGGSDGQT
jgi:hypothetical protein